MSWWLTNQINKLTSRIETTWMPRPLAQHFNNGLIFTSHPWPAMVRHQLPPNVPRSNLWIFLLDSKCNSKSHLKRGKPWKVRSDGRSGVKDGVGVLWDLSWTVVNSIYIYCIWLFGIWQWLFQQYMFWSCLDLFWQSQSCQPQITSNQYLTWLST